MTRLLNLWDVVFVVGLSALVAWMRGEPLGGDAMMIRLGFTLPSAMAMLWFWRWLRKIN